MVILFHASVNLAVFLPAAVGSGGPAPLLNVVITWLVAIGVVLRCGADAAGIPAPGRGGDRTMSTTTPAAPPTTMGLPITIGLIVALAGPFLVQFVLAPLIMQSPLRPTTAVLLSQAMLWLLAGTVIAITRRWERKPWSWLGLRPISWRAALLACVLGVVLVFAVRRIDRGRKPAHAAIRWGHGGQRG